MTAVRLIPPVFQPRIWGGRDLRAWYPERGREATPIGEAWLTPPGSGVLVKLLFPQERLSVQVHPDDAYAAAHGLGRGKSEAWYVLEASAEARLGVGLRPGAAWAELGNACRAGRGADLLDWLAVEPGDVVSVPAGTVHAIGPGVVLCEVQQPSDNTFRLDDYGRGRELHLEHGLAVARSTNGGVIRPRLPLEASGLLLETEFFRIYRHCVREGLLLPAQAETRWVVNVSAPGGTEKAVPPRGFLAEVPPRSPFSFAGSGVLLEIATGTA